MVKRLILLRHAKSSWDDPTQEDRDRPLNKRGRRSARAIGKWLTGLGVSPDLTLCSDAARARETCERLKLGGEVRILPGLYMAGADVMMGALQQAEGACVMLIAHNPGIGEFAAELVATPPDHDRFADYPTGATLIVRFDAPSWDAVRPRSGRVTDFAVPRQFTD